MVAGAAQTVGSPVARLALLVDESWWRHEPSPDPLITEFLGVVRDVGSEEQAMKIRVARLLAWCRGRDVGEAGYPSWTAFVKELSPWRSSRTRDYVRLVESPLDVIKDAVAKNEIDVVTATRAVRELGTDATREAQVAWLLEATLQTIPMRHRAFMDVLSGSEIGRVWKARDLAEILIGWDAPVEAVDRFLLDCHGQKLTGEQIVERAREVPPKPPRLDGSVPEWRDDPTASLLGPWEEPADIHDAVAKLRAMDVALDLRRMLLGRAYWYIRYHALWTEIPGCLSLEECCVVHLEIGQRSFQRYAHEGLTHEWYPQLRKEITAGRLTTDRAMFAVDNAGGNESEIAWWLRLVRRLSRTEMAHAQKRKEECEVRLRDEYAPVLEMARRVEALMRNMRRNGSSEATAIGGSIEAAEAAAIGGTAEVAARLAAHFVAKGAKGQLKVALRDDADRRSPPKEPPRYIFAPRGLLAAADYLLAVVELPKLHGARKTIGRDRYTCQSPRCRRRTLRVHHHHLVEQQHGGTDEPANIVTGCPACHLRMIHSNRMAVVRFGDWLAWTWPDGDDVLMHSPVRDL